MPGIGDDIGELTLLYTADGKCTTFLETFDIFL